MCCIISKIGRDAHMNVIFHIIKCTNIISLVSSFMSTTCYERVNKRTHELWSIFYYKKQLSSNFIALFNLSFN